MGRNNNTNQKTIKAIDGGCKPIHSPGLIQPHGVLLVLNEPELAIQQVSRNTLQFLGLRPRELLNKKLEELIDAQQIEIIKQALKDNFERINPLVLNVKNQGNAAIFNGTIHRSGKSIILELEPKIAEISSNFFSFYHFVKAPIDQMQKARTLDELCQLMAREIRNTIGFDRVMIYRFDRDGSGVVVAEEKAEHLMPLLGLHYPASDIPKSAEQLYMMNLLRFIPDVNYQPVKLTPQRNPVTKCPLDMSLSVLRGVSHYHIDYLRNMGVAATMTISLIRDRQLWGMIACHHQTPKYISYEMRTFCEFLGRAMVLELGAKQENQDLDYQLKLKSIQSAFFEAISQADNLFDGLIADRDRLLALVGAQGAAVYVENRFVCLGQTPAAADVRDLMVWVENQNQQDIFYTDSLPKLYPKAEQFKDVASGLLLLSIAKIRQHCILWFRSERIQTVTWKGNPNQQVTVEGDRNSHLSPHNSFELWQERVRLTSLPWKQCEIDSARELRNAIVGIVLRKADELAQTKVQLEVRVAERTADLSQANDQLQYELAQRQRAEEALYQQVERERLIGAIAQHIRESLNLTEILNTAVSEVQALFQADRVLVYRVWSNGTGSAIAEATAPGWIKVLDFVFPEEVFPEEIRQSYLEGRIYALTDRDNGEILPCLVDFLAQIQVRAKLVIPIIQHDSLWGLLIAHQCSQPREWQAWEISLLQQLANQMAIAIQQSELYQKLQEELRERQRVENALRQSEALFRSLSESAPIGIFRTDQQGQWIYTNPRCQAIGGFSFEAALGNGWKRFTHPEDLEEFCHQWEAAAAENQEFVGEIRFVRRDGTVRFCRVRTAPVFSAMDDLTGHVGTVEDITESQAIAQMKNEFISIVSHELRTPLTAIRGSLGLLANGVYDQKPQRGKRMLEIAATQTDRLVRLVNDILDLGRLESGRVTLAKQNCDAAALMLQSVDAMRVNAEQNQITLSVNPLNVQVWAAPDSIVQTLTNLISNAIKFSEPGSTVWLTAELAKGGTQETRNPSQTDNAIQNSNQGYVLFQIKDQGRGIPTNKLETIFGQFQQVDASDSRKKGGTGLGLAICRSIIQQHGGQIWAESILGEGSCFYFTLPLPPDRSCKGHQYYDNETSAGD